MQQRQMVVSLCSSGKATPLCSQCARAYVFVHALNVLECDSVRQQFLSVSFWMQCWERHLCVDLSSLYLSFQSIEEKTNWFNFKWRIFFELNKSSIYRFFILTSNLFSQSIFSVNQFSFVFVHSRTSYQKLQLVFKRIQNKMLKWEKEKSLFLKI